MNPLRQLVVRAPAPCGGRHPEDASSADIGDSVFTALWSSSCWRAARGNSLRVLVQAIAPATHSPMKIGNAMTKFNPAALAIRST